MLCPYSHISSTTTWMVGQYNRLYGRLRFFKMKLSLQQWVEHSKYIHFKCTNLVELDLIESTKLRNIKVSTNGQTLCVLPSKQQRKSLHPSGIMWTSTEYDLVVCRMFPANDPYSARKLTEFGCSTKVRSVYHTWNHIRTLKPKLFQAVTFIQGNLTGNETLGPRHL